jgi:NADPH:quinone reductase-like Zn-dependent oxidoreductase
MKAVKMEGYGGREQLSVCEFARPTPKAGQVLVRVAAVSVNAGDHHMLTGRPYLVRLMGRKEIPGMDLAGTVEAVGAGVAHFSQGDPVFGTTDIACGAFAEHVCVPAKGLSRKPEALSWEEAAGIPTAGMTALQALRTGRKVEPGQRVLIHGASGGVGTFAVQLAKSMGAHVTAVCSAANVDLVRSLGADEVVDYTKQSVTDHAIAAGLTYNKILDIVGRPGWRRLLRPSGAVVAVALPDPTSECVPCQMCRVACSPWCCCCASTKKAHIFLQAVAAADLAELAQMAEAGKLRVVLGLRLTGIEQVPDALAGHSATLGQGHRTGKTTVTLAVDPQTMRR